jgi:hypothetical protein
MFFCHSSSTCGFCGLPEISSEDVGSESPILLLVGVGGLAIEKGNDLFGSDDAAAGETFGLMAGFSSALGLAEAGLAFVLAADFALSFDAADLADAATFDELFLAAMSDPFGACEQSVPADDSSSVEGGPFRRAV